MSKAKAKEVKEVKEVKENKEKKKKVTLTFESETGKDIMVAGSFNEWELEDKKKQKALKEDKKNPGVYSVTLMLTPGEYEYKFFCDGRWIIDPNAETNRMNRFGTHNSILAVAE